jgi:hypothetical protein
LPRQRPDPLFVHEGRRSAARRPRSILIIPVARAGLRRAGPSPRQFGGILRPRGVPCTRLAPSHLERTRKCPLRFFALRA